MAAEFQVGPKTPDFALFAARIREAGGRVSVLEHDDTSHIKIILSFAALFRGPARSTKTRSDSSSRCEPRAKFEP